MPDNMAECDGQKISPDTVEVNLDSGPRGVNVQGILTFEGEDPMTGERVHVHLGMNEEGLQLIVSTVSEALRHARRGRN